MCKLSVVTVSFIGLTLFLSGHVVGRTPVVCMSGDAVQS